MKRNLFIKIIALALITAAMPAKAADVRQSGGEDKIIVSGNDYNGYENVPIMILAPGIDKSEISALIASGGDISDMVIFSGTAVADMNGGLSYFIPMGSETQKGIYNVYVGGEKFEVGFEKNTDRVNIVDLIVNAGDTLPSVLESNYMYLSIDSQMYKICSSSDAIAEVLKKEFTKTPVSSATENAVDILSAMFDKSILVVAANEKKLTSFNQIEEKLSDCTNTKLVTSLKEQISEDGKSALLNSFQGNGYASVDNADKRYAQELVLKAICYPTVKTSTALLGVLDGYNSVLGLDLSDFNSLSKSKQAEVIVAFSGENPTVATMQSVLNNIVKKYNAPVKPSTSGGGGGGGGGSYVVSNKPATVNPSSEPQKDISVFNDLSNVSWAKEAILNLHAKGIISGYGNGVFAPDNNIKREEFIKLVVSAYYADNEAGKIDFTDVADDAWYYDCVGIAVNQGIISGIDDNNFGSGMNITRQDMAVILHRVAGGKFTVKDSENKFDDDSEIADYAKEAVYALRDAGIINGVSDSEFAPDKNATRAETAVMLYRFMNLYGGGV